MKRETTERLQYIRRRSEALMLSPAHAADALATDAEIKALRAEVKRKNEKVRYALARLGLLGFAGDPVREQIREALAAALRPLRKGKR